MKKIIAITFILVGIFWSNIGLCAPSSKNSVVRTEIETADGFILVGDFYPSKVKGKKMPLVILLHSFGGKSSDWGVLPQKISAGGNNVFALDLRGHGRSVYTANLVYQSRNYFSAKTWLKFPKDVLETINYMRENYSKVDYSAITFVGADIGANTAVLAANSLKNKPPRMVLISPAQDFKGLYIPIVISNFPKTSFMLVVSKADKYFLNQTNLLSKFIQTGFYVKYCAQGGSGTLLLKKNPETYTEITNFIYGKKPAIAK